MTQNKIAAELKKFQEFKTILNINGPINAGKSTVSKLLAQKLDNAIFIEVDYLMSDAEEKELGLSMREGWRERLKRLDKILAEEKTENHDYIIFAYPMDEENYQRWCKFADETTRFVSITLAPPMEVCLQNRGKRALTEWEQSRIKQMYEANFHKPRHADLIIDNSEQTPEETAQKIIFYLGISVRAATPDDAYDIKKIHKETYQASYRGYIPDDYLDNIPLNDEIVARTAKYLETAECRLAVHQKQIIAFAYVTYPEDDAFEVNALYVHPQYQKCGAGSLLVNELCKEKKKAGYAKCVVWTMKFGTSLSFYNKLNFEQTAEEKNWKFDIPIIKLIRQL